MSARARLCVWNLSKICFTSHEVVKAIDPEIRHALNEVVVLTFRNELQTAVWEGKKEC